MPAKWRDTASVAVLRIAYVTGHVRQPFDGRNVKIRLWVCPTSIGGSWSLAHGFASQAKKQAALAGAVACFCDRNKAILGGETCNMLRRRPRGPTADRHPLYRMIVKKTLTRTESAAKEGKKLISYLGIWPWPP